MPTLQPPRERPHGDVELSRASFSFSLRAVTTNDDLLLACSIRGNAYGRRNPASRDALTMPDCIDASDRTVVFLCEDKAGGKPIGTMRVQTTSAESAGVEIEKYVTIPQGFLAHGRAEMGRLAVVAGSDPLVRWALWKAGYLHCVAHQVKWLLVTALRPGLVREYEHLGARDISGDGTRVCLPYAMNLPHLVMALDLSLIEENWRRVHHPMFAFMIRTRHPDMAVYASVNCPPAQQCRVPGVR